MDFDYESPGWEAEGEENEDLKTTGFTAGYKPPASIFNWFWTRVSNCITELQSKIATLDSNKAKVRHQSTSTTYGMGTDNYYGHVRLSDSVSDESNAANGGYAATPAAVKAAYDVAAEAQNTAGITAVEVEAAQNTAASAVELASEAQETAESAAEQLETIDAAIKNIDYADGIGTTESSEGVILLFSDLRSAYDKTNGSSGTLAEAEDKIDALGYTVETITDITTEISTNTNFGGIYLLNVVNGVTANMPSSAHAYIVTVYRNQTVINGKYYWYLNAMDLMIGTRFLGQVNIATTDTQDVFNQTITWTEL